jgi:hypothetical protein
VEEARPKLDWLSSSTYAVSDQRPANLPGPKTDPVYSRGAGANSHRPLRSSHTVNCLLLPSKLKSTQISLFCGSIYKFRVRFFSLVFCCEAKQIWVPLDTKTPDISARIRNKVSQVIQCPGVWDRLLKARAKAGSSMRDPQSSREWIATPLHSSIVSRRRSG